MLSYLLGIVTPFAIVAVWLLVAVLFERGLGLKCHYCQDYFGDWDSLIENRRAFNSVTRLKFWWHRRGRYHRFMKRKHVGEVAILREAGKQTCLCK